MGTSLKPQPPVVDAKFKVIRGHRGPPTRGERILLVIALGLGAFIGLYGAVEGSKAQIAADREARSGLQ